MHTKLVIVAIRIRRATEVASILRLRAKLWIALVEAFACNAAALLSLSTHYTAAIRDTARVHDASIPKATGASGRAVTADTAGCRARAGMPAHASTRSRCAGRPVERSIPSEIAHVDVVMTACSHGEERKKSNGDAGGSHFGFTRSQAPGYDRPRSALSFELLETRRGFDR